MFNFDKDTCAITLHAGDTGSKWIHATRKGGDDWTDDDRCLFTVKSGNDIVMQRIYRLDDQWGAGAGIFLFELHNNDTSGPVGPLVILRSLFYSTSCRAQ